MSNLKFSETVISSQDKKGVLAKDENGYYTIVLGGLNAYNNAGEYYVAEGVVEAFEDSSHFMRRVNNGALYAELGHPKRAPGMSFDELYKRVLTIDERNVCAHISEVWLDYNYGKEHPELCNNDFVAIMGKVKPAGPHANTLQLSLENPKQNTAFSIRGLTENKNRNNRVERKLTQIITFDHVNEPGIKVACKAYTPGLESFFIEDRNEIIVNKTILLSTLDRMQDSEIATESTKLICNEVKRLLDTKVLDKSKMVKW